MSQRFPASALSPYDDMPFSHVLFRFLWPFWLFQNASRGDRIARAAAYRHNREMRVYLPGYLIKWVLSSALTFGIAAGFEALATVSGAAPKLLSLLAAGCATAFACGVCVLFVTAYIYLYLSRHDG